MFRNKYNQNLLPSKCVKIENFLTQTENQKILESAIKLEPYFEKSTTSSGLTDTNIRKSKVLYLAPISKARISNRIKLVLPQVLAKLARQKFPIAKIEAQVTAHNHGNYYHAHDDNGTPNVAQREITYVYYFYQQPKQFSGGELVLYDEKINNNLYQQANSFKKIAVKNNTIVFFLSRYWHEVLPINCPSKNFADSRFTINGWVWKSKEEGRRKK
ncbi:2OG-Fe(II) oxygenase [Okeania sp.]|uniref:2OG-Fe(II) oxygenase n=1 Tax=Okeania sp. TaxID=3100323 RepID=UPI002B4AF47A|nr:2OG-Fe(II) oxygenase [Okeania sp.]MEB3341678.1 2OG-Fe(II) oxygenase [Okeania sp.]